ncbi:Detected protein of unknown function [Hibiscus syriacus]|uniref:Uncharacterized protein n=1 Tax=Hibiscus syriacus TaxID=106335 RepID=A0A6A3BG93_HIBSY|nr:uncharacterized protein LOC120216075 [Hibiscus syriacus]KAE8716150.1 Detected protein of unknown function [Hibiscus syriacus]
MKLKNIGKVYPSPPSSSSSSCEDYLSVLKLLPAAILAIASVLSLEDREVLAYMITRSLNTTTTTTDAASLMSQDFSSKKKASKKPPPAAVKMAPKGGGSAYKPPILDCDCFDCYTIYWFRWDSSPNRERIHQVIEAFEDHLTQGETKKPSKKSARLKRKDGNGKMATRVADVPVVEPPGQPDHDAPVLECPNKEAPVCAASTDDKEVKEEAVEMAEEATEVFPVADSDEDIQTMGTSEAAVTTAATSNHKGLARKVLPDVLGLLNSRLWGLWNPNVYIFLL